MARRSPRLLGGLACAALLAGCGAGGATSTPSISPDPFVADVDVGGRTLHIVCSGPTTSGRPTVVFENGSGPTLNTWSRVIDELQATDRSCAYDRAGIGDSEAAPSPWTTQDQVDDLARLLVSAGVSGPVVLVAHSLGGWNAILYTADHPDQVAGVVLVDIVPPGLERRWLEVLPPEAPDEPAPIREAREEFTAFRTDPSRNPEGLAIADSEVQVQAAPGFGARPTEILWASNTELTVWPDFEPDLAARLNAATEDLLREVEALADEPRVTRVATGHAIQEEQPGVVLEAIRRVLDQVGS
jgi:pimeloyl-ACP methyl ester carboxylesterase